MSELQKFRGVFTHKDGGYIAHIGHQGKRVYLGWFRDFSAAREARVAAEIRLFGAVFDRRGIEMRGDYADIPLHGRNGVFYGYAQIDLNDLDLVKTTAWTIDPRGYVAGRPPGLGRSITLHRWLVYGSAPTGGVDHRDGNRLNNRRRNLRKCTPLQNSRNTRIAKNNTSGFKGVSATHEGRWRARITVDRKEIRLGVFDTPEQAASAYDDAAKRLHGDFASPNSDLQVRRRYGAVPGVSVIVSALEVSV